MPETEWEKEHRVRQAWLDSLKAGDRFAMSEHRGYSGTVDFVLGKITKITAKRKRFDLEFDRGWGVKSVNADGYETSSGGYYKRLCILPITDQILATMKGNKLNERLGKLVMDKEGRRVRSDLTFDQIERIIAILEEVHGQAPEAST